MFRSYSFWIGAGLLVIAAALSFTGSPSWSIVAFLCAVVAGALITRSYYLDSLQPSATNPITDSTSNREEFGSATLLQATMTGMREGLLVVDRDLRVVASNSAAQRLFSLANGNPNNKRLTELTRNPSIYDAFLDALKGKERSGVKVELHDPVRHIFDLRVVPLWDEDDQNPDGAIGVFFDISRLEKLERVRQEFLSNVSHELRTPLTAILAFVETLEAGTLEETDDNRRFLAIIRKNAMRMHALIDDILELSAIEAGNVKVQPSEVSLYPLVNDVVTSLAAKASSAEIVINNLIDPRAVVFADPPRLEQMLTNLLENAIKFNRKDGQVTITYQRGEMNRIMVQDTGEGIPAQHLERLFERFYRVDRARSRELGGTGLGLAIVKHLAMAHGGEVRVQSKLGEGSTFWIDLPVNGREQSMN